MTVKVFIVATLAFALTCVAPALAHGNKQCTSREASQADSQIDDLARSGADWLALHRFWSRFRQCDDGSVAEVYSDVVVRLIADHWNKLSQLAKISDHDKDFKKFVLRHIDPSVDDNKLQKIIRQAKTRCRDSTHRLCMELASQARAAQEESKK